MPGPEPAEAMQPTSAPVNRRGGVIWLAAGAGALAGLLLGLIIMMPQTQTRTAEPLSGSPQVAPTVTVTAEPSPGPTVTATQTITEPPETTQVTETVEATVTATRAPRPRATVTKTVTADPGQDDSRESDEDDEDAKEEDDEEPGDSVYYKNCTAARDAGDTPLYRGDPGYASHLDRDGDGVACE